MPRNALGRGLGALIRELEGKKAEPAPTQAEATTAGGAAAGTARRLNKSIRHRQASARRACPRNDAGGEPPARRSECHRGSTCIRTINARVRIDAGSGCRTDRKGPGYRGELDAAVKT